MGCHILHGLGALLRLGPFDHLGSSWDWGSWWALVSFQLRCLIESIPRDWKSVIKNDSNGFNRTYRISNDVRVLDKTIPLQAITSRIAYTLLTKPLIEKPTAQKSISELLGTSDINWRVVYQLPHRVTNETSLLVFQYKILNNILYLNNRLHKFGFVESPLCSLCNREPESILHLFCNCQETQKL